MRKEYIVLCNIICYIVVCLYVHALTNDIPIDSFNIINLIIHSQIRSKVNT